jgi:hypothetical protein
MTLIGMQQILEVIDREGECADTLMLSHLIVRGYVVESGGRLVLTIAGRKAMTQ